MPFPVEELYIQNAESELGVRFPDSFRNKMQEANGGRVDVGEDNYELHPFYDTSNRKRITRTCNSIVHETKKEREGGWQLPDRIIVIGNNGSGDKLVFQVEANGCIDPSVYWFDHETRELKLAAKDFNDLPETTW